MCAFFSPIHSRISHHPLERAPWLRCTTHFFDFGQKAYTIQHLGSEDQLRLREYTVGIKSTSMLDARIWGLVSLRVIAIATVIIPLIMFIGMITYRLLNPFRVKSGESLKEGCLPPELQKKIFEEAGLSTLLLAETNSAYKNMIELDPSLSFKKRAINLLKQSFDYVKNIDSDKRILILKEISRVLADFSTNRAVEVARTINKNAPFNRAQALMGVSKAHLDREKAFEIMDQALEEVKGLVPHWEAFILLEASEAMINIPEKALAFLYQALNLEKNVSEKQHSAELLVVAVKILALLDQKEESQILADRAMIATRDVKYRTDSKLHFFSTIIKALSPFDKERSLLAVNMMMDTINAVNDYDKRNGLICKLICLITPWDLEKALEIANAMDEQVSQQFKISALTEVAAKIVLVDQQRAIDFANASLLAARVPMFTKMAKSLATSNPEIAYEMFSSGSQVLHTTDDFSKIDCVLEFIKFLAPLNPAFINRNQELPLLLNKALNLTNALPAFSFDRIKLKCKLAKSIALVDKERATNIAKQAFNECNALRRKDRDTGFLFAAKTLLPLDLDTAKEAAYAATVVKKLKDRNKRLIAEGIALIDLDKSLEVANSISDRLKEAKTLIKIAKKIIKSKAL